MQKRDNKGLMKKDIIKAKPGKGNGIRIILDLHTNFQATGSVYDDYQAFNVFVGEANEFPNLRDYGLSVQPGHEHFLSISNTMLRTDPKIRTISPEKRNCYFPDKGNLELYKIYTFSNCQLECSMKDAERRLGCTPWYLPQAQNSTLCDPWAARNFSDMMSTMENKAC